MNSETNDSPRFTPQDNDAIAFERFLWGMVGKNEFSDQDLVQDLLFTKTPNDCYMTAVSILNGEDFDKANGVFELFKRAGFQLHPLSRVEKRSLSEWGLGK
ncbi:MAG: hypothetical protein AAF810_01440 [Cyanobacteria bacterium P01_D01_bin.36]